MTARWRSRAFIGGFVLVAAAGCGGHRVLAAALPATSLTTSPVTLGLNIKPGATSTQKLQVMNNTTQPLPITMQIKTFGAYGNSGEAAIGDFPSGDPALGWIHLSPNTFVAQPGAWTPVQATISLPKSASLGYYYAIIFQPVIASQPQAPGAKIIKGSNAILALVDTGSAGEQRQVEVANFTVSKKLYEYLPGSFSVTIHNQGNIFLAPTGDIFISRSRNGTHTITSLPINPAGGNVLPNSKRTFRADWSDGFPVFVSQTAGGQPVTVNGKPVEKLQWDFSRINKLRFGKYYARLAMQYYNGNREVLLNATVSFWVIPWKILLIPLAIVLLLFTGLFFIGRAAIRKFRGTAKKLKRA